MPVMVPLVVENQLSPAEKAISSSFALIVSVGGKPDGGLAKRTGLSLVNVAGARKKLVGSGVVQIVKTAHADIGKRKRVFRFSQAEEMGEDKAQPEAANSPDRIEAIDRTCQLHLTKPVNSKSARKARKA